MKYELYREENFNCREWGGGTSKELVIFPQEACYEERDFIWRLSSAVVMQEGAMFTRLPEYDRVLMVLEGDAVLAYEGQRVVRLRELEQDRFDGGFSTKSFGQIRDYNLMVRKGQDGYLDVLELSAEKQVPECEDSDGKTRSCQAFFCHKGYAVVTFGDNSCMVREGEQLVIYYDSDESAAIGVMGEGTLIRAQIYYNDRALMESEPGKAQPRGTFEDFLACVKLSATNFRGSHYVFPGLRNIWYDESLKKGIRKAERFYLPMLLWLAGMVAICFIGKPMLILYVSIGWSLFAMFLLSPLIYFRVVPKPVKDHIKRAEELSKPEQALRQAELKANPVADKIIETYRWKGRGKLRHKK